MIGTLGIEKYPTTCVINLYYALNFEVLWLS